MVLPLLGLLGAGLMAGGATALGPLYEDFKTRRAGRRQSGILDAMAPGMSMDEGLFRGGLLSGDQYSDNMAGRSQFDRSLGQDESQYGRSLAENQRQFDQPRMDEMRAAGAQWGFDPVSYLDALKQRESGGNYAIRGNEVTSGQYAGERALGAYQVMPGNLPSWLAEAGMPAMTEAEFLDNPDAQDQLALTRAGAAWQRYGNVADMASEWFTGGPLSSGAGSSDVNGVTGRDYAGGIVNDYGRRVYANTPEGSEVQTRGAKWATVPDADKKAILGMESAINVVEGTIDYVDKTTAGSRAMNPEELGKIRAEWDMTVLPFMQQLTSSGAMQEAELDLFREWAGNGFSWVNFSNKEKGKMEAVLDKMQTTLGNTNRALGLWSGQTSPWGGFEAVTP